MDSLPSEPTGKPKNTGVCSLSLLWPRNWTRVSCITGRFFTNWDTGKTQWRLFEIINACRMLNMVLLVHNDNPANASSSSSSRNWWRMQRHEVTPPPDFKVCVFSLKHFGITCLDFYLMLYHGHCGPFESVESSLPLVLPTLWVFFSTRWTSIHGSSARDMDQEFLLLTEFLPLMVLFCAVTQTPSLLFSPQQLAGSVSRRSFSFVF